MFDYSKSEIIPASLRYNNLKGEKGPWHVDLTSVLEFSAEDIVLKF